MRVSQTRFSGMVQLEGFNKMQRKALVNRLEHSNIKVLKVNQHGNHFLLTHDTIDQYLKLNHAQQQNNRGMVEIGNQPYATTLPIFMRSAKKITNPGEVTEDVSRYTYTRIANALEEKEHVYRVLDVMH